MLFDAKTIPSPFTLGSNCLRFRLPPAGFVGEAIRAFPRRNFGEIGIRLIPTRRPRDPQTSRRYSIRIGQPVRLPYRLLDFLFRRIR